MGNNSINRELGYAPPHSKGPGAKIYILTIYALSAPPHLTVSPAEVNREVLLAAMKGKILASSELPVVYARGTASAGLGNGAQAAPPAPNIAPKDAAQGGEGGQ